MPYSPMPLNVAQIGNVENIICDLKDVTRRMHQNKKSFEQQPQQKLAVLKLQFQSQNLSRTTTSRNMVGIEVIRSDIKNFPRTTTSTKLGGICSQKRYQAVGFPYNRMLKLNSSRGIRADVPVLSVSWSFVDHSVIIRALRKGHIEREAIDTGGVPRWKSSCPDRLAEATISR